MSLRQRDLVKAVLLASGIGVIFVIGMFLVIKAVADENDSAVGGRLHWIGSGSPSQWPHSAPVYVDVPASADTLSLAVVVTANQSAFKWVYWDSGDTELCVFSVHYADGHSTDAGGGRPCSREEAAQRGNSCGYFGEGFGVMAVATSCANAGIDECGGLLCY